MAYPDGHFVPRWYGEPDGMHVFGEVEPGSDGSVTVHLPFEIDGL